VESSSRCSRSWVRGTFFAIVKYPDNETAFRVLAKIGLLEVVKTETFPAEPVELFVKALA
jgi:hypothetical protein